jgi:hypothetical protein
MALTTESVMDQLSGIPLLSPPDGMRAEDERDMLIEAYPALHPGGVRVITADLADIYRLNQLAAKHFDIQKHLAANAIRRALMDCGIAADQRDGSRVATRRISFKATYEVPGHTEDAIHPA